MAGLASTDFKAFKTALAELVDVYEGNETSFARQPKFHGHHEIEFFGLMRGSAIEKIVPRLEELFADIATEPDRAPGRIAEIDTQFRALLTRPEFADENSPAFAESLYMNLTGEVYAVSGEGAEITEFFLRIIRIGDCKRKSWHYEAGSSMCLCRQRQKSNRCYEGRSSEKSGQIVSDF